MIKRIFACLSAAALVSAVLITAPARAQEGPATIPEQVNIEDPRGDANGINDQGGLCIGAPLPPACTPYFGDQSGPAGGTVSDILKVWFTDDAETINAHIQTAAKPPASTPLFFRVPIDPGTGSNCLWFQAFFSSSNAPTNATGASLRDTCDTALGTQDAELVVQDGPEGSGVITIKVPRSLYPTFTDGSVLKTPTAHVRLFAVVVTAPVLDGTKPGTDYTIGSGGGVIEEPKKAKKKDTKAKKVEKVKAKNKKKKKKGTAACKPFEPGEAGAEAETVTITDEATAEKPVEQAVELDPSAADVAGDESTAYFNVQVDTKNPAAGLHALFEFPPRRDYDLLALWPDGSEAASAHLFNPLIEADDPERNHAGESTDSSEHIVGLSTPDCGGWTMAAQNWLGEGGEFTITLWLGDPENEPAAPGEGQALAFFWILLGV